MVTKTQNFTVKFLEERVKMVTEDMEFIKNNDYEGLNKFNEYKLLRSKKNFYERLKSEIIKWELKDNDEFYKRWKEYNDYNSKELVIGIKNNKISIVEYATKKPTGGNAIEKIKNIADTLEIQENIWYWLDGVNSIIYDFGEL